MNETTIGILGPFLIALAERAALRTAQGALGEFALHPKPAIAAALQELLAQLDREEKAKALAYEHAEAILQFWALRTRATQPERVMDVAQALAATHPFSGRVGNDIRLMANRLAGYARGLNDDE